MGQGQLRRNGCPLLPEWEVELDGNNFHKRLMEMKEERVFAASIR